MYLLTQLVSIITVSYNASKTIEQTILSVINQTYTNIQYIIIDGKSTDETIDIVNKYKEYISVFVSEKDNGIYDAMNKGISLAQGELIGIINADDWYELDTVETVVKKYNLQINQTNCLYYGMLRIWREEKEYCVRQFHHNFVTETVIQHPTNFVPKALYDIYGGFDASFKIAADYDLLTRFRVNQVQFIKIDKILANFREGGASITVAPKVQLEGPTIKLRYGIINREEYNKIAQRYKKMSLFKRIKHAIKYLIYGY